MKNWTVKTEGDKNQIIEIEFEPLNESIKFIGKCRFVGTNDWIVYCEEKINMNSDLEKIKSTLFNVHSIMNERLKSHLKINTIFDSLKIIEIKQTN